MIYNVLPANVSAFGVAVGLVGVLLSANRFVRLASNPLAAYLLERFGASAPTGSFDWRPIPWLPTCSNGSALHGLCWRASLWLWAVR